MDTSERGVVKRVPRRPAAFGGGEATSCRRDVAGWGIGRTRGAGPWSEREPGLCVAASVSAGGARLISEEFLSGGWRRLKFRKVIGWPILSHFFLRKGGAVFR